MGVRTDYLQHVDHPGKTRIASPSGEYESSVLLLFSYCARCISPLHPLCPLLAPLQLQLFLQSTSSLTPPNNHKSRGSLKSGEAQWRTVEDGGREFVIPLEVFGTSDDGYSSFDDAVGRSMLLK